MFWWIVSHVNLEGNGFGVGFRLNHAELKTLFNFDLDFEMVQPYIWEYEEMLRKEYDKNNT